VNAAAFNCIKMAHYNPILAAMSHYSSIMMRKRDETLRKITDAITSHDISRLRRLLECKANPNDRDPLNRDTTILELALLNSSPQIVQTLLDHSTHPIATNTLVGALMSAMSNNRKQALDILLDHGDKEPLTNIDFMYCAVQSDNPSIMQKLLDRGGVVNAGEHRESPLRYALRNDCLRSARFLLDHSAKIEAGGCSPSLIDAVCYKNLAAVELMLEYKADPNYMEAYEDSDACDISEPRRTALHYANEEQFCRSGQSVVKLLVDHKADVNAVDHHGQTPLHRAAWKRRHKTVKQLLLCKARVDVIDAKKYVGCTPLDLAVIKGDAKIVKLLLKWGSNYDFKDVDCCRRRTLDMLDVSSEIRELLEKGCFVWQPERHTGAPRPLRMVVKCFTMIRSLVPESCVSSIPNELLFEIFAYL